MNTAPLVLIVDDEEIILKNLSEMLEEEGYRVSTANKGEEVFHKISMMAPDVILLDMKLSDMNGIDLIPSIKKLLPHTQIIIISGYGEISDAVRAIKEGAFDFLEKPVHKDRLLITLKNAVDKERLLEERELLEKEVFSSHKLVGKSSTVQKMYAFIEKVADIDSAVLITGETGTGKDLLATLIHFSGKRRNKKFVKINCATIPAELLESELLDTKKGHLQEQ